MRRNRSRMWCGCEQRKGGRRLVDSPLPAKSVWTGEIGNRCSERWVTHFPQRLRLWSRIMSWVSRSIVELRREFVSLASREGSNVSELCRRFGISRKTGYKWLGRGEAEGSLLSNRSRRPLASPKRTAEAVEAKIVSLRGEHPAW